MHYKANLMEIKSKQENFRLREWKLTDIVSLVKHINNEKIWNNVRDGLPYPYTMLDADKYIRMVQAQPYVQNFAIEVAGEAVGGVGIVPLTDVERFSAEVGYWLGEDYPPANRSRKPRRSKRPAPGKGWTDRTTRPG